MFQSKRPRQPDPGPRTRQGDEPNRGRTGPWSGPGMDPIQGLLSRRQPNPRTPPILGGRERHRQSELGPSPEKTYEREGREGVSRRGVGERAAPFSGDGQAGRTRVCSVLTLFRWREFPRRHACSLQSGRFLVQRGLTWRTCHRAGVRRWVRRFPPLIEEPEGVLPLGFPSRTPGTWLEC
jgi:hypothetical protein